MTAPNPPNAVAFWFIVGPIQSGEVAIVPLRTNVASNAPGRSERIGIARWSRKRGVQSQKTIEPAIQSGSARSQPLARSSDAEPSMNARRPLIEEEPDRVPRLVGSAACMDTPRPRIHVLVELSDRDPPDQEADKDGDRRHRDVVRSSAEQVADNVRSRTVKLHVPDYPVRERTFVASGQVEERR